MKPGSRVWVKSLGLGFIHGPESTFRSLGFRFEGLGVPVCSVGLRVQGLGSLGVELRLAEDTLSQ